MPSKKRTNWKVSWYVPFSPATDFLMPGAASGREQFQTEEEVRKFVYEKSKGTMQVGPHDGEEIFGFELMFTIEGPNGEHYHAQRYTNSTVRKGKTHSCEKCRSSS